MKTWIRDHTRTPLDTFFAVAGILLACFVVAAWLMFSQTAALAITFLAFLVWYWTFTL